MPVINQATTYPTTPNFRYSFTINSGNLEVDGVAISSGDVVTATDFEIVVTPVGGPADFTFRKSSSQGGDGGSSNPGGGGDPLAIGFEDENGNTTQANGIQTLYLKGTGQDQGGGDFSYEPESPLPSGGAVGQVLSRNGIQPDAIGWTNFEYLTRSVQPDPPAGPGDPHTAQLEVGNFFRQFRLNDVGLDAVGANTTEITVTGLDGPFLFRIEKGPNHTGDIVFPGATFYGFKPNFKQANKRFFIRGSRSDDGSLSLVADEENPSPFAGGTASINPAAVNPLAWFDAQAENVLFDAVAGGSLSVNGGAVNRWEDISGNGNHLTTEVGTPKKAPRGVLFNDGGESGMRFTNDIPNALNIYAVLNHKREGNQFCTLLCGGRLSDRYNVRTDNTNWRSNNTGQPNDDWTGTYRTNDVLGGKWEDNIRYLFSAKKGTPKGAPDPEFFRSLASASFAGRQFRGRVHELIICGAVTDAQDIGLKQYLANRWNLNI